MNKQADTILLSLQRMKLIANTKLNVRSQLNWQRRHIENQDQSQHLSMTTKKSTTMLTNVGNNNNNN